MLLDLEFRTVELNGRVELWTSFNPGAADQQPQVSPAFGSVLFVVQW